MRAQENRDAILLKLAVAILAECEGDLLMQEVRQGGALAACKGITPWHHLQLLVPNSALSTYCQSAPCCEGGGISVLPSS